MQALTRKQADMPRLEEQAQLLGRRHAGDDAEQWLASAQPLPGSW
jgi:hypothetical protein